MNPTMRVGFIAGVAALALVGARYAGAAPEAASDELRARIAELEAKSGRDDSRIAELESRLRIAELESRLAAMESRTDGSRLTEQRAQEIRNLVEDVLADAQLRSSLQGQAITAGYEDGAVISSPDGDWLLRTNLLLQERFMLRSQSGDPGLGLFFGGDDTVWGFENTRTKFILSGNVVNPQWFYRVSIEVSNNDNATVSADTNAEGTGDTFKPDSRGGLDDAYLGYDFQNGLKLIVGAMKAPLLFEELVDSRYQQAVERSLVNYLYTGGYTDGVALEYTGDQFRVVAMYNNGISDGLYGGLVGGPSGTGGTSALVSDTDFALTVRGEWLAMGTWDLVKDYTSPRDEEPALLVGGAAHWQTAEQGVDPTLGLAIPDIELLILTADLSMKFGGGNIYGALIYANATQPAGFPDVTQFAFIVGGGVYLSENWEFFGRYEWSNVDFPTIDDVNLATIGISGYFARHNAKWTTDIGFSLNTLAFEVPVTGWAIDAPGDQGQFVLRSQIQIVF